MRALLYLFLAFAISCQGIVVVTCHYYDYDIIQEMAAVNTQALLDEFGDSAVERYWLEVFRQQMDTTGNRILRRAMTKLSFSKGLINIQPFYNQDSVQIQYLEKVLGCTDLRGRIKKRLLLYLESYDTLKLPILPEFDRGSYRIPPYGMYVVTHIFPYPDSSYIPQKDKHSVIRRVYFGMDSLKKQIAELKQNVFTGPYIEQEMGIPFLEYPLKELLKDSVKPDSTWHHPIFR